MHKLIEQICGELNERGFQAEAYASGRALKLYIHDRTYKIRVREKKSHYEIAIGIVDQHGFQRDYNLRKIPKDSNGAWLFKMMDYITEAEKTLLDMIRLHAASLSNYS